ncbi:MAG: hypothetical protein ACRD1D_11475 [Acidimicrobiales bacterium]
MAAVSVLVDDAVQGHFPLTCAKTGRPADLLVAVRRPVAGDLGLLWFLVLLGPGGLAMLMLLALLLPGATYLTVRLPQTEAVYRRDLRLERLRVAAFGLGFATCAGAMVTLGRFPLAWLGLFAFSLVAAVVLHTLVWFRAVDLSVDPSGRWVTVASVHPEFARAVDARETAPTAGGR